MMGNYTVLDFLFDFLNDLTLSFLILTLIQNILLFFWLLHVLHSIYVFVNRSLYLRKRRLENSDTTDSKEYFYKESIMRYVIFFVLLLFEIGYFLDDNLFSLIVKFHKIPDIDINIGYNCTLTKSTTLNFYFDTRAIRKFETFLTSHGKSLLIALTWMYAVLMQHLLHAAKGKLLSPKKLIGWILFGCVQHVGTLCYSGLIVLNVIMICRYFISKCKRVRYRYHVADALYSPLLLAQSK